MYPLELVSTFPYLVHTIMFNNSNWEALYQNLRKAQSHWGVVLGVLVKSGATVKSRAVFTRQWWRRSFFKEVIAGSSWTLWWRFWKGSITTSLGGFGGYGMARQVRGVGLAPSRGGPWGGGTVAHSGVCQATLDQYWGLNIHNTDLWYVHWGGVVSGYKSGDGRLESVT